MNLDSERKAFEEWHKKEYADKLEWDNSKGEYKDYIDETMWQTWQASANREGYKLVPVEPNQRMLITADNCEIDGKVTAHNIYKAMINSHDNN